MLANTEAELPSPARDYTSIIPQEESRMARYAPLALAVPAAIVTIALAQAAQSPPRPAPQPSPQPTTQPARRAPTQAPAPARPAPRPQGDTSDPNAGNGVDSDVEVPIGQAAAQQPQQPPPADAGYGFNNPGGIVSAATAEQQAVGGVHYHYHYHSYGYGPGPGYTATTYENPATSSTPGNPFLTPVYGPGNPAPMNTLAGGGSDNTNAGRGGGIGAAAAAEVGGQAWSYGGGIGHWNPYAYGGAGYVEGFND